MHLRFLGKNSAGGESPTLYAGDRETYIIQGWKVTDGELLAKLDLPDDETCVEIPAALFDHLTKDGLSGRVVSWVLPIVEVTDNGNYVVQGKCVADRDTLAQMAIPAFEDCVEVSKAAVRALVEVDELGTDQR